MLVHLDLEHVHFDRPWEPVRDQERSRRLQLPVIEALQAILDEYRVPRLRLLTGRGQHIVWRLDRSSRAVSALAWLGNPGRRLRELYRVRRPPADRAVGEWLGAAHDGLGKVLEHLGHRLLERCDALPVPVQLTAVTVGPGPWGREIVSFDLSQFGDPLYCRSARMPFTVYRKNLGARVQGGRRESPFIVVPVIEGDERRSLEATVSFEAAGELARSTPVRIPEASLETEGLIVDYFESDLCRFHQDFDAARPEPPERWKDSYDRLELDTLPGCVARMLGNPNDLLLQPAGIQHLVRSLTALGWEPRHVAGLLRSKYERDHGWIPGVHFYEPGIRADFYTRLFAGLAATGRDPLTDFNCRSADEKWLCARGVCAWDLRELRDRLMGGGVTA